MATLPISQNNISNYSPEQLCTPRRSYPLIATPSGVSFDVTPRGRDKENVVYAIYKSATNGSVDESDAVYVGKTAQAFGVRLAQHASKVNCGETSKLYDALRNSPEDFSATLLETDIPPDELDAREKHYIQELDSVETGLNGNRGGGGAQKIQPHNEPFIRPTKVTPDRYYPLKRKQDGKITVALTPSAKKSNVIYVIKKDRTDHEPVKRFVGRTCAKKGFPARISGLMHDVNHPEKRRGQKALYEEIRKNHDLFSVGVLYSSEETGPSAHLRKAHTLLQAERHFIQLKKSDDRGQGYNRNKNGAASSASPDSLI